MTKIRSHKAYFDHYDMKPADPRWSWSGKRDDRKPVPPSPTTGTWPYCRNCAGPAGRPRNDPSAGCGEGLSAKEASSCLTIAQKLQGLRTGGYDARIN